MDSWNIVFSKRGCFDENCRTVISPHIMELLPNTVTELTLDTYGNFPVGMAIKIVPHLNHKCWRIMNNYIYPDVKNHTVTLWIISDNAYLLQQGESVCHFQIAPVHTILDAIHRGMRFEFFNKSFIQTNFFLFR